MIEPCFFYDLLKKNGTEFFTGVPDSLLKSFCAYISDTVEEKRHIISVNEGTAAAHAAGYYLAVGGIPLVYMQNSGLGNAINPLLSLADQEVYSIPMVLVIGWRGEPGIKDEPQHVKQGKVTLELLDAMKIPYAVLADSEAEAEKQVNECFSYIRKNSAPFAFVVRKDVFGAYALRKNKGIEAELSREEAIDEIILAADADTVFFSTTGMISRELYELRIKHGMSHERDFLTVGSMGHASQIALTAAMMKPDRQFLCLDGDGAVLMHMGGLALIGSRKPENFRHIILNNGAHDSVGGQPTVALEVDIPGIAAAAGYRSVYSVKSRKDLCAALADRSPGPVLIEVVVHKGSRTDLGRPKSTPVQNKKALMEFLGSENRGAE